jgi:hypothetical protein
VLQIGSYGPGSEECVEELSLGAFRWIRKEQETYFGDIGELPRNLGIYLGEVCVQSKNRILLLTKDARLGAGPRLQR